MSAMSKNESRETITAIAFTREADGGVDQDNALQQNPRGRVVRMRRPPPVLVCRKCLKRAGDGKAIKRALKDELKARAKAAASSADDGKKTKRAKLVLTSCFGICPKGAVALTTGERLAKGEYVLVETGDKLVF
jgi:hypothetical protein